MNSFQKLATALTARLHHCLGAGIVNDIGNFWRALSFIYI